VLLTRGPADTLEAFLLAAETLAREGNRNLILCEPGCRSFEPGHPDTREGSAIPILKGRVPFPIVVDLSHAAGHPDILLPLGRAALAAGADGVMVALHTDPPMAHSDNPQPLSYDEFRSFHAGLAPFLEPGVPS
jgi:3-deoxy-7-phosphoheptulonate synthase/chorismate mutase